MRAVLDRAAMRRGWAFVLFVLAAVVAGRADEPEMRTWKDPSGRFKIQAKYAGMNGSNVMLKKADGSQMQVGLEKLCSADRQYVEARLKKKGDGDPIEPPADPRPKAAAAPRPKAAANRTDATTTAGPGMARELSSSERVNLMRARSGLFKTEPIPDDGTPLIEPDWSGARPAEAAPGQWKLDAALAPARSEGARPQPVALPPRTEFSETQSRPILNAPATHAVVGYQLDGGQRRTRLVWCDLRAAKRLTEASADDSLSPLALSDSGDRVLMRRAGRMSSPDWLELWALGSEKAQRVWRMVPHGEPERGDKSVHWAAFLGPDRFATVGGGGTLTVWDLDPVRPVLTTSIVGDGVPGVSPDRKRLAFFTGGDFTLGDLAVLDVESGRLVARRSPPAQLLPRTALSFSPSGGRIGCITAGMLFVWDATTGELRHSIQDAAGGAIGVPPAWPDDDHVLAGSRLFDVNSEIRMWEYDGVEAVVADREGLCWFLPRSTPSGSSSLNPIRLPEPGAVNGLRQALADPEFFVLRPGATVTIDVTGLPDAWRGRVAEIFAARLAQHQVKTAPGSPLVLTAVQETGNEQEVSYQVLGRGAGPDARETFPVRPQISRLTLTYQGKVAWAASVSTMPRFDFAQLGPGETLADHVRKFEQASPAFFESVGLPDKVPRPRQGVGLALGRSTISPAGGP